MSPRRASSGGRIDRARTIRFTFDGRSYSGHAGDTLASALLANGVTLFGRSFKYHRPRGIMTAGIDEPNGWATEGYIRFVSEDSLNYQPSGDTTGYRVKKWSVYEGDATKREIWLHNALPFLPESGDEVVVERGCTRDVHACRAAPNRKGVSGADDGTGNVVNMFMAFPYMPGVDIVITKNSTPDVGENIDLLGLFS